MLNLNVLLASLQLNVWGTLSTSNNPTQARSEPLKVSLFQFIELSFNLIFLTFTYFYAIMKLLINQD